MGGITITTNTRQEYPAWRYFDTSDSKWLAEMLTDAPLLPVCAVVCAIDVAPLQKIWCDWNPVSPAAQPERWTSDDPWLTFETWCWQPPDALLACIDTCIAAFAAGGDLNARLETERQRQQLEFLNLSGFDDEEMEEMEGLIEELGALRRVVERAAREGATTIQLSAT